jgi:site-specific DNA-methyltransferase (adenine-specific)
VLEHGTGGLNIDGSRVAHASADDLQKHASGVQAIKERGGVMADSWKNSSDLSGANDVSVAGRFPANIIHDGSDEVLAGFPITSPARRSLMGAGGIPNGANNLVGSNVERNQDFESVRGHTDSGTAARFFYCAKASKRDRNEGLDGFEEKQSAGGGGGIGDYQDDVNSASGKFGSEKAPAANHHPTVKPTDLMRYLVKLITPPNGIVLDPFTGSGSTGKGAVIEGFTFIGIELDPDYVAIATARIQHQIDTKPETEPTLFNQTN